MVDVAGEVEYLRLRAPLTVRDGSSTYTVQPSESLSLEVTIDFPHPLIGRQSCQLPRHAVDASRRTWRARVHLGSFARPMRCARRD